LCTVTASDNPNAAPDPADKKLPTFREYREKVIALAQSAKGAAAAAKAASSAAALATGSAKASSSNPASAASASAELGSSNADPATGTADAKPLPQLKKNVASTECGAKALDWNKEAKDVDAILTDNRDLYMKNLCSAEKWLDLQLCEPVRLRRLELANFELFSSAFKNVSLLAGDVHPPREWIQVANLTLNASRTWQIFDLHTDQFVQYIRLRFSEHWGSEHYCTLTHLRLMGILAADIVDDDPDGDDLWSDEHQRILSLASNMDGSDTGAAGADARSESASLLNSAGSSNDCSDIANSSLTTPAPRTSSSSIAEANIDRGSCPANCTFRRLLPTPLPSSSVIKPSSNLANDAALKSAGKTSAPPDNEANKATDEAGSEKVGTISTASSTADDSLKHPPGGRSIDSYETTDRIPQAENSNSNATNVGTNSSLSTAKEDSANSDSTAANEKPSLSPATPLPPPPPSVHHPPLNPPPHVNGGGGGGGFAVLASRLKELERNVSLSMRYLEELSLAFNRHVQRLAVSRQRNSSKITRRRFEIAQMARISALERRLEAAPFAMCVVHCVFLALHAILLTVCLRRRGR
ncbi:hypothetical protein BOX15_Mlig014108g2, partial [Macrostomum lignano]